MSLTLPLSVKPAADIRTATVLYCGVGTIPATLTVRVEGEPSPCVIMAAPGQIPPRVGSRVSVQRRATVTGVPYWALEGDK